LNRTILEAVNHKGLLFFLIYFFKIKASINQKKVLDKTLTAVLRSDVSGIKEQKQCVPDSTRMKKGFNVVQKGM